MIRCSSSEGRVPGSRPPWWFPAVMAAGVALMAGAYHGSDAQTASQGASQAAPAAAYDQAVTDTARVLAGLEPEDAARFARVTNSPAWRAHRTEFDRN